MALVSVEELLQAGVHYGHHTSRWNPKMARYIFGKRNSIHIINLIDTLRGLIKACKFLKKLNAKGEEILLVGTKRQAAAVVAEMAQEANVPYVSERWLGGMLTNFQTIRSRLSRLVELEELEESGKLSNYSKKEAATLMREKRKIARNLDGVRNLTRLPGALIVIDPRREKIAVLEAKKLGIPVIALIDTDCNPDNVNIPIPGNDDAIKSIQLNLNRMLAAALEGREMAREQVKPLEEGAEGQPDAEAGESAEPASEPSPSAAAPAETAEVPPEEPAVTETAAPAEQSTQGEAPAEAVVSPGEGETAAVEEPVPEPVAEQSNAVPVQAEAEAEKTADAE